MPDQRQHRGPHPQDAELFAPAHWPALRAAVAELSWLLSRGYATPSALKIVGDRHNLTERQRTAVMRCACSDQARRSRLARELRPDVVAGKPLLIDGYNVLTSIEAALAGGVIIVGRDTCWRDMASIHGTYRKVEETIPALKLAGQTLAELRAGPATWYLDSPVSNSGRLAGIMRETALQQGWNWTVEIVASPDAILAKAHEVVATADSVILDRCSGWLSLAKWIIQRAIPAANCVDLERFDFVAPATADPEAAG
jgi:hypothetical protein